MVEMKFTSIRETMFLCRNSLKIFTSLSVVFLLMDFGGDDGDNNEDDNDSGNDDGDGGNDDGDGDGDGDDDNDDNTNSKYE